MNRESKKTVTKHYDTAVVNGWDLNYEYESENGGKPTEVKVNGTKDGANISVTNAGSITSITLNGADIDSVLLESIGVELLAIKAAFEIV